MTMFPSQMRVQISLLRFYLCLVSVLFSALILIASVRDLSFAKAALSSDLEVNRSANSFFLGRDHRYSELVETGQLYAALRYACRKYKISCDHHKISIVYDDVGEHHAAYEPWSNQIKIYRSAFDYHGTPHPGWLAAIVLHEIVHTQQSKYIHRIVKGTQIRLRSNYYWDAVVEIEAWDVMRQHSERLELNCAMQNDIEAQIHYYSVIMNLRGKAPKDEDDEMKNYSRTLNQERAFLKFCEMTFQRKFK